MRENTTFLPVCKQDMMDQGIEQLDFVYVSGDAYVDHPSFGTAIIARVLQSRGYSVGIIAQPDYKDPESINILGEPRLGFLVSSGNMDSMVNHYFVSKKKRPSDAYTPGGAAGIRPDRAVIVYSGLIRKTYKKKPIILGGIEASLRRLAHYDYWSDSYRKSVLLDAQADLISYGMGERSIVEIADALDAGIDVSDITFIKGTVYKTRNQDEIYDSITLPSYEDCVRDKANYAKSFGIQYNNTDAFISKTLIEPYPDGWRVVQNPPQEPLSMMEMDDVYALPYTREPHPMYEAMGGVPATREIKFSLISNRGCFGGCSFCALTFHQGRTVQVRSHESILEEAKEVITDPEFKGYIHDVGGPTANFRRPSCDKQLTKGVCPNKQCLFPKPCGNLKVDHTDYIALLRKLRKLPGVKKVFIRSGIRFDYVLADSSDAFLEELCKYHISGQLKVAPEHISDNVLRLLGKPENSVYEAFVKKYNKMNERLGLKQYLVPYLMSSHPGSTLKDAIALAEYLRDLGYMPEQVQDFYPTPSTISTVMYYTGLDPRNMQPVNVVRNPHEKAMQRALIQYRNPDNYELVKEALTLAGRTDLIGFDKKCLIKPRKLKADEERTFHGSGSRRKDGGNRGISEKTAKKNQGGKASLGKNQSGSGTKRQNGRSGAKKRR